MGGVWTRRRFDFNIHFIKNRQKNIKIRDSYILVPSPEPIIYNNIRKTCQLILAWTKKELLWYIQDGNGCTVDGHRIHLHDNSEYLIQLGGTQLNGVDHINFLASHSRRIMFFACCLVLYYSYESIKVLV